MKYKIDVNEVLAGSAAFRKHEKRDAMYKTATFLIEHFWGNTREMANGLGVILLTWNNAFYRYGPFDFDDLENTIREEFSELSTLRQSIIASFSVTDESLIQDLFQKLLLALQIQSGNRRGRKSPVAVSTALHLLAPQFFPLWDERIANSYKCNYSKEPDKKYVRFMYIMKEFSDSLMANSELKSKDILKTIDEYNYAKLTKGWL